MSKTNPSHAKSSTNTSALLSISSPPPLSSPPSSPSPSSSLVSTNLVDTMANPIRGGSVSSKKTKRRQLRNLHKKTYTFNINKKGKKPVNLNITIE